MPNKDGWQIGRNVIMENCKSIDQANYGFLLQGGSWYCINCEIVSKSGAVNTQLHYFGDTPMYDYGSEYAFIGCSVLLNTNRIFGSKGFAGHYTDAHTLPYVTENIYIIGCRCEGVHQFVSGYKSKNVFIKDAEVVGVPFVNSGNNIIIDGLKGTVNGGSTSFVYIDNTDKNDLITKNELVSIAKNALEADPKDFNYKKPRKSIVNYKYIIKYNKTKIEVRNKHNAQKNTDNKKKNQEIISRYYNPNLTIKENIEYIEEYTGIRLSDKTIRRWKKDNGLSRNYNKKNNITIEFAEVNNSSNTSNSKSTVMCDCNINGDDRFNNNDIKDKDMYDKENLKECVSLSKEEIKNIVESWGINYYDIAIKNAI